MPVTRFVTSYARTDARTDAQTNFWITIPRVGLKALELIKSAHLWLLLIVIKLIYTRIGFVSLIYVLV